MGTMNRSVSTLPIVLSLFFLAACSKSDPGPFAGSWKQTGAISITVHFRPGEVESAGIIVVVTAEEMLGKIV